MVVARRLTLSLLALAVLSGFLFWIPWRLMIGYGVFLLLYGGGLALVYWGAWLGMREQARAQR